LTIDDLQLNIRLNKEVNIMHYITHIGTLFDDFTKHQLLACLKGIFQKIIKIGEDLR